MADTIQLVQWALGQTCPVRPPREDGLPESPSRVLKQVRKLQTYARELHSRGRNSGVYGDICVTFATHGARPGGDMTKPLPTIPSAGFIISKTFAPYGGIEELKNQCSHCPANIAPPKAAQCAGYLEQQPNSPETEEQLRGIISRLGLEKEVAERFSATTPLWYGLWAVSPVPAASLPLLRLLLSEMLAENRLRLQIPGLNDEWRFRTFQDLITAIGIAEKKKLLLHVELLPPGHTDFGLYTIFPHCPFCKADARLPRWKQSYSSELLECHVCGTRFSPAATASHRKASWFDFGGLRKEIGDVAFLRVSSEFLQAQGEPLEEIPGILAATNQKEREIERKNRERLEEEERNHAAVETHVYCGLPRVDPPSLKLLDGEDDEDYDEPSAEAVETDWFAIKELEEILRRCELLGVEIIAIFHYSRDESLTRSESLSRGKASAATILAQWKAEGCNEKFRVSCRVPKDLLQ